MEKAGLQSLTAAELNRLPVLYRSAVSSLSVATAISLDKNLLDYLTALVGRAYIGVYGAKRRTGEAIAEFFRLRFPWVVRRYFVFVLAAYALMGLGVLTGYRMTLADPERYYSFVGDAMAQGRNPASSTKELREILYSGGEGAAVDLRHLPLHPQLQGGHALLRPRLRGRRAGGLPAVHQRPDARGDGGALPVARPGGGVLGLDAAARRHRAERRLPVRRGRHGDRHRRSSSPAGTRGCATSPCAAGRSRCWPWARSSCSWWRG